MNCIIIADRHDKGLKGKGWSGSENITKKETLIDRQIRTIKKVFPKSQILYIYGFDYRKFENYIVNKKISGFKPIYNEENAIYGEVHSVSKAIEFMDTDCLLFFSNSIVTPSAFANFDNKKSHIFTNSKIPNELGCSINEDGTIIHIFYGLENYLSNMFFIHKTDIDIFRRMVCKPENRNCFIFEIFNNMIECGIQISTYNINHKKHLQSYEHKKKKELK